MLGRFFGEVPFFQHVAGDALQFGILLRLALVPGQFQTVAVGIEEIDRFKQGVVGRADHVEPFGLDLVEGGQQRLLALDLKGDVLDPFGRILIPAHGRAVGYLEEGQHILAACVQKHMHVRVWRLGRRHLVFSDRQHESHAEHPLIEVHRLFGILTAIGDVVDAVKRDGMGHAGSACKTPRRSWSRSMDLKRAVKLPSPKPSSRFL